MQLLSSAKKYANAILRGKVRTLYQTRENMH